MHGSEEVRQEGRGTLGYHRGPLEPKPAWDLCGTVWNPRGRELSYLPFNFHTVGRGSVMVIPFHHVLGQRKLQHPEKPLGRDTRVGSWKLDWNALERQSEGCLGRTPLASLTEPRE